MKTINVVLYKVYEIEVEDDFNFKSVDKMEYLFDRVAEQINDNWTTVENEFWENLSPQCSECGVSLNLDEEIEEGKCVQCQNQK